MLPTLNNHSLSILRGISILANFNHSCQYYPYFSIFFYIFKTSLALRDKIVVIMSWRKKNDSFGKIKEVTELQSLPGFEGQVRNHIRQKITPHVDRIETDGLGGIFGIKDTAVENAPRILVVAHMDEVGFMISQIKPDGTFRVVELGGWNPLVVSSQAFTLQLQDGRTIPAISGSVPPHLSRGANALACLPLLILFSMLVLPIMTKLGRSAFVRGCPHSQK